MTLRQDIETIAKAYRLHSIGMIDGNHELIAKAEHDFDSVEDSWKDVGAK